MDITEFWKYVLEQDAAEIRKFFCKDGYVNETASIPQLSWGNNRCKWR